MKRMIVIYGLIPLLLAGYSFNLSAQCAGTKKTAGTYASWTLTTNEYVAAGETVTVTGTINGVGYTLCNAGTIIANQLTGAGQVNNYGKMDVAATFSVNTWYKSFAADDTLMTGGNTTLCAGGTGDNPGVIICSSGDITMNFSYTNSGKVVAQSGNLTQAASYTFTNNTGGYVSVSGNYDFNGSVTNNDTIRTTGGFFDVNTTLTNNAGGYIECTGDFIRGTGGITTNAAGAYIYAGGAFTFNKTVNNSGHIEGTGAGGCTVAALNSLNNPVAGAYLLIPGNTTLGSNFDNYGTMKFEGTLSVGTTSYNRSGGTLAVCGNADFSQAFNNNDTAWFLADVNFADNANLNNNAGSYLQICGNLTTEEGCVNYETMEVMGNWTATGGTVSVDNEAGAIMAVGGTFRFLNTGAGSRIENYGTITVSDSLWIDGTNDRLELHSGNVFCGYLISDGIIRGFTTGYSRVDITNGSEHNNAGANTVRENVDIKDWSPGTSNGWKLDYFAAGSVNETAGNITYNVNSAGGTKHSFGSCKDCTGLLPVQLLFFTALAGDGTVTLHWATASETNNDFFTVEKSADGMSFEQVMRRKGAGNSALQLNYSAVDPNPLQGISYYRLKQTDYDGKSTYSSILSVDFRADRKPDLIVFPNPAHVGRSITLMLTGTGENLALLSVYDMFGHLAASGQLTAFSADKGFLEHLDAASLQPGAYIVRLITQNDVFTARIVIR